MATCPLANTFSSLLLTFFHLLLASTAFRAKDCNFHFALCCSPLSNQNSTFSKLATKKTSHTTDLLERSSHTTDLLEKSSYVRQRVVWLELIHTSGCVNRPSQAQFIPYTTK